MGKRNKTKAKEIKKLYDETACLYNLRYTEIQKHKYSLISNDILTKISLLKKPLYLVDIGCGTGIFFKFLFNELKIQEAHKKNLLKYICADISPNMMKKTFSLNHQRQFYDRLLLNAEFLPLTSHSFKFVFSFTMLQNMSNPLSTLNTLISLLALNGFEVISILKKVFTDVFLKQSLNALYGISSKIQKISKKNCEDILITVST